MSMYSRLGFSFSIFGEIEMIDWFSIYANDGQTFHRLRNSFDHDFLVMNRLKHMFLFPINNKTFI